MVPGTYIAQEENKKTERKKAKKERNFKLSIIDNK